LNFRKYLEGLDRFHLVALESAVSLCKSVAIGEALLSQVVGIQTALTCARLEEEKQILENGRVEGSHDIDEINMLHVLSAARNLVVLKSWP
jgi:chaperone required for assembly of F1-ATPase